MKSVLDFAKSYLIDSVPEDGVVADFTMGNGHDTLFLCGLVPKGKVYAFDIQEEAVTSTGKLLAEHGVGDRAELIHGCHSTFDTYIETPLDGGMFNLGYLPWSDKQVTTRRETTLLALGKAVERLRPNRAIVVVIYPGHEEGRLEGEAVQAFAKELAPKRFDASLFRIFNIEDCPYVVAIEKRK